MAMQYQPVEFNSFVRGIVTQASPLTFPENATVEEKNFVLNKDGSRDRRLGMDFEEGYVEVTTSVDADTVGLVTSTFNWKNAGGASANEILVVQIGRELKFFNILVSPVSANLIATFTSADDLVKCSYAVVDGILVVSTGAKQVLLYQYDGITVSETSTILYVRDVFGVEDIDPVSGHNLTSGNSVAFRPAAIYDNHLYNLRNQSWAEKRYVGTEEGVRDPVAIFFERGGVFPSNADYTAIAMATDPGALDRPTSERFKPENLIDNPVGTFIAARGHFVIDAMHRGTSRMNELTIDSPIQEYEYDVSTLPSDQTPGGPSVITEYAGRVFYSGFSGEVIDGDSKSPRMSSFILFSQLVSDISDINKCYSLGDPTSRLAADPLEIDGGSIRIDGAYNIQALVPVGEFLMVVAENGIWRIRGGSDYGFNAINYAVDKLFDIGAIGSNSIVVVENKFFYWSKDGIYQVAPNRFGEYEVGSVTKDTIQQLYDDISVIDKQEVVGVFDSFSRTIRWVYQNRLPDVSTNTKELILDVDLSAFYISEIESVGDGYPKVVSLVESPPYFEGVIDSDVTASGVTVTASAVDVFVEQRIRQVGQRETLYLCVTQGSPISFTFSRYQDQTFTDWVSFDDVGVDADAYMVTGYLTGGDSMRTKRVPYVFFHFRKTETGFEEIDDQIVPVGQSSCIVQSQWNWTNSLASGKWGTPFQTYRHRRLWIPPNVSSGYDDGYSTVTSKSKLRGSGRALSFYIHTEPQKDCRLLGWAFLWGVSDRV